jgi:hypothetical protein
MENAGNLFLRGDTYYGRFFRSGKLVRVSLQTPDIEEARARLEIMMTKAEMEKYGRINPKSGDVIYFIHDHTLDMVKVGITRNIGGRLRSLKSNTPSDVSLIGSVHGSLELEKVLHRFLTPFHHRREWFRAPPKVVEFLRALVALENIVDDATDCVT